MEPVPVTPKVVVSLVERNGSFVLIQRQAPLRGKDLNSGNHWILEWVFPGGLLKPDETDEQAVIRETLEEVGLNVEVVKLLHERKHPQTYVPIAYFACRLTNEDQEPIIGEPREISKVEWVNASGVIERFENLGLDIDPFAKEYVLSFVRNGGEHIDSNGNTKER